MTARKKTPAELYEDRLVTAYIDGLRIPPATKDTISNTARKQLIAIVARAYRHGLRDGEREEQAVYTRTECRVDECCVQHLHDRKNSETLQ